MSMNIHTLENLRSALLSALHLSLKHAEGQNGHQNTDKIIDVLRQVELTTLLQESNIYAIAGTQGAGKTTLAKEILNIDDRWLAGNPGRGEQVPLFIEQCAEMAAGEPEIVFVCLNRDSGKVEDLPASAEELKSVLRDWSSVQRFEKAHLKLLYPKLRISQQQSFINENVTWALLPGYELITSRNHQWQEMMRHVLVNARGVLFVTDQTLLANDGKTTVLDDLRENFNHHSPVIVISKTEALTDEDIDQLKASARARFSSVSGAVRNNVVATGAGNRDRWISDLRETVIDNLASSYASEAVAIDRFMHLIKSDVAEIIDDLHLLCSNQEDHDGIIDDILSEFDKSVTAYENKLRKAIKSQTHEHLIEAVASCKEHYKKEEVGFINNAKILGRRFALRGIDVDEERRQRVIQAWNQTFDEQDINSRNFSALTALNHPILSRAGLLPEIEQTPVKAITLADKMGYQVQEQAPEVVNQELAQGISVLLHKVPRGQLPSDPTELQAVMHVLPALTLEYSRAAIVMRQDPTCTTQLADEILPQVFLDTLFSSSENYHPIKTAMMAFIGADLSDGTPGEPTAENPGGAFTPLALVGKAALVASLAYGLYQLTGIIRESDKAQFYYIDRLMNELAFFNEQSIVTHYLETMADLRQHIEGNIKRIYGVEDSLSHRSTITLAIKKLAAVQKEAKLYEANVRQILA